MCRTAVDHGTLSEAAAATTRNPGKSLVQCGSDQAAKRLMGHGCKHCAAASDPQKWLHEGRVATRGILYSVSPCDVLDSSETPVDVPGNGTLQLVLLVMQLCLQLLCVPALTHRCTQQTRRTRQKTCCQNLQIHSQTAAQNEQDKRPSVRTYRYTHKLLHKTNKKNKTKDLLSAPTGTLTNCCTQQKKKWKTGILLSKPTGALTSCGEQVLCQNLQAVST